MEVLVWCEQVPYTGSDGGGPFGCGAVERHGAGGPGDHLRCQAGSAWRL